MTRNSRQLDLFAPRPTLPLRPFSLDFSPYEILICRGCGKPIITQRRNADGTILSEFVSNTGACWTCTYGSR
jgi:hypothetical protein